VADVRPIILAKCGSCHTGNERIANADPQNAYNGTQRVGSQCGNTIRVSECILIRINNGSMPQNAGCTGDAEDDTRAECLAEAQEQTIQAWLDQGELFE